MLKEKIVEIIEKKFGEEGLFLVEFIQESDNVCKVFIDGDEGVSIQRCTDVSRALEFHLEFENLVPENYTLEVSSPGVGNPLKLLRQYKNNIDRYLEVFLKDQSSLIGKLMSVEEEHIVILPGEPKKKKPGGPKPKKMDPMDIKFEDIIETKVLVVF